MNAWYPKTLKPGILATNDWTTNQAQSKKNPTSTPRVLTISDTNQLTSTIPIRSIQTLPTSHFPPKMSGADSPEILAAYDAVRSDKDPTNYLIISYASAVGDKLQLSSTGTGGLSELSSALSPTEAQYAYVRIEYANDTESKRVKFVLIIWIGEGTKVMRKARVSIESGAVKRVLGHHSIQVDARDKGDLEEEEIVKRLRKAGGADYNGGRG